MGLPLVSGCVAVGLCTRILVPSLSNKNLRLSLFHSQFVFFIAQILSYALKKRRPLGIPPFSKSWSLPPDQRPENLKPYSFAPPCRNVRLVLSCTTRPRSKGLGFVGRKADLGAPMAVERRGTGLS